MKKQTLTFGIILFSLMLNAQYFDVGIYYGTVNYKGDLSRSTLEPTEYNPALGTFFRYHLSTKLAIKGHAYGGFLTASDSRSGNRKRNLSFRSNVLELGSQIEYNLISYEILDKDHVTTPYVFVGASIFYFNPLAEYRGGMVALQPLGTEGQGIAGYADKYSRLAWSFPLGLGIKLAINEITNIGVEFGFRPTTTDYIDDVSGAYADSGDLFEFNGELAYKLSYREPEYTGVTNGRYPSGSLRGNPDTNDSYFFGGILLSFNLRKGKLLSASSRKGAGKTSYTQRYLF